MRSRDSEAIHEPEHIAAEVGDLVGARGDGRIAVAPVVVPNDPEVARQLPGLRIPRREGAPERVGEDQRRRIGRPLDDEMNADERAHR